MAIEFWLSYNNGAEKLRLPVNPPTLSVSSPFSNTDIEVVQLGEFTVIGDRGLKEFSFESFFPRDYNPSYCEYSGFPTPTECMNTIERWRDTRKPIRFIVTGTSINYAVTVRDFPHEIERAGNPGDIYYSLDLKEFRFLKLKQEVEVKAGGKTGKVVSKQGARPPVINTGKSQTGSGTYTVKANDTLSGIAYDKYRDKSRWRDIFAANRSVIGPNPDKIKVGQKLVIPK
jgi:nucleoid-associated protein YgaU